MVDYPRQAPAVDLLKQNKGLGYYRESGREISRSAAIVKFTWSAQSRRNTPSDMLLVMHAAASDA